MPSLNWDGDLLAELLAEMRGENLRQNQIGIFGCSENHINFEADGKEYVLTLHEVKDGEHWSEYLHKVRHGKWIERDGYDGDTYYDCSVCGESWTTIDGDPWDNGMNYCPKCGAKMGVE